jgi:hypothetical protein
MGTVDETTFMRKTLTIALLLALGAGGAWAAASKKAPAPSADALHPCTEDCTTRQGGYAWAEHYAIADAANCKGKSVAFVDGCKDYVADLNRPPRARNDDRYEDRNDGRYDDRYDDDGDDEDYDDDDNYNNDDDDDEEYEDDGDDRGLLQA